MGWMMSAGLGFDLICCHLSTIALPLLGATGCPHLRMMAATAQRILSLLGVMASCANRTPGRTKGKIGHCHRTVGFGTTLKVPSYALTRGQPGSWLSGVSFSFSADAGNSRMTNFITMPLRPSDVLEICQPCKRKNCLCLRLFGCLRAQRRRPLCGKNEQF